METVDTIETIDAVDAVGQTVEHTMGDVAKIQIGSLNLGTLVTALIIFLICFIFIRVIMAIVHRALHRSKKLDRALVGFLESAVKITLWSIAIIIIAGSLGIPTASLVALVSVAGLALSLSIQSIMANLFSGITLLITKPFGAGDYVDIAGKAGTVKSIGLFYTVLDTPDNTRISIPNGDVTAAAVKNFSAEPIRRIDLTYSASYDSPAESVMAAIIEAARGDERILTDPAPYSTISAYKGSSIDYLARVWCKNTDYWAVLYGMNERIGPCFTKHGVEMTYDHLNVHVMEK